MNILRILGLVFVGGCVISILAAVVVGSEVRLFIAAIAFGIIGNVLWWLGRPHPVEDEDSKEETGGSDDSDTPAEG